MSGKVKNKGSSNYDTHNNIMALEGDIDEQMKYKINKVMEVVKNRSQDDVMLVLQYFDFDIDTTVDAFLEDGAADILKKWNHTNPIKPTNKNKKKKKNKKKSGAQDSVAITETVSNGVAPCAAETMAAAPLSNGVSSPVSPLEVNPSQFQESNRDCAPPTEDAKSRVSLALQSSKVEETRPLEGEMLQRVKEQDPPPATSRLTVEPVPPESDAASTATAMPDCVKSTTSDSLTERSSVSPSADHSRSSNRYRHRSSGSLSRATQEASRTDATPAPVIAPTTSAPTASTQAPGKKILEKSLKDLSRQTVALQRVSNLLEEELDNSFKRIKTAISEAQRLLEDRSQALEVEMERVKKESRLLLKQRKELAAELRQRAERASTMGEAELNELRADIKHFVVERKYDEELGKTRRFLWDKDRITDEIKAFGEVHHVANSYSQRRQSVSSVASSSNMTSSITEPPDSSPVNQTVDLDQEITEPNQENVTPDSRPQGASYPRVARFFFPRRNFGNTDTNRPYNRGTYPPRGRGGGESRGGRGGSRGGRRDDGYRGGHDSYYSKPHYTSQKMDEQHGSSAAGNASGESASNTNSWPPRDQRTTRRSGRHNPRYQGRVRAHHSPRRNYGSNERAPTSTSEAHVNGSDEPTDLMNGFVDH